MPIKVVNFKDVIPADSIVVNTTSRAKDWGKELSPFFIEGGKLYDDMYAKNVENAWQFSKVYPYFADSSGEPTDAYFEWARAGFAETWAHRYPMGKGTLPLYSYWGGEKYDYIDARKKIYAPLYSRGVVKTDAFAKLKDLTKDNLVYLQDFDAYDNESLGMTLLDVLNNPRLKMGHAFVLAMMLDEDPNIQALVEPVST